MKAGILTFHKADNYGAVLQAYALQKTLDKIGIISEFIEFEESPAKESSSAAGRGGPFAEKIRAGGKARAELFDSFRKEQLKCSPSYRMEDANALNDLYDVFVAGSDQIWNARLPEADGRYFLPFAAYDKRISYAASFGMDSIPQQLKDWYAQQLAGFRALSVREEEGKKLVKELTERDSTVCLDPVLLLEPTDWEMLTHTYDGKPYLFLYMVGYDNELATRARQEAEKKGLELRVVTAGFMPQYGLSAWSGVGVEEWLSLIRNAAVVYTNSFHSTAFSLIFERPVSVALLKDGLSHRNGRLEELLQLAGINRDPDGENGAVSASIFTENFFNRKRISMTYLSQTLE